MEDLDEDLLVRWVQDATVRNHGELPAFPAVASRLVDLLEQPDAEIAEVESLVSQDQVVSAQVLRMANSVVFVGASPVESVSQAVMRLGLRETAQVALAAACRALFSMEDRAELETFPEVWRAHWHDSLVAAYGGRLLGRELKRGQPERIFLCGMFRNLGGLLILKMVSRALVRGELALAPGESQLRAAIARLHPALGADYLRCFDLPDYVIRAAAHHHDADLPFDPDHADLHVLRLADGLCDRVGVAPFAQGELGPLAEESAALFEIGPERLEHFELQFQDLADQLRALV